MRGSPSAAELLVLVSALSLCSLFLTYQLALPSSGRPPVASHVLLQVQQDANQGRPAALASNERRLHQLLRTLERQQQGNEILTRRIGLVRGLSHLVARDLPVITAALASIAFDVANFTNSNNTTRDDWSLLMCQSLYDSDCQLTNTYASLRRDQRVNHIPGVRLALGLRSSLCSIQTRLAHLGLHQKYQNTEPFCFTLPQQYEELLNAVDNSSFNTTWFLKPIKNITRPEILTTAEIFRRARSKQLPGNVEAVLQQAVEPQLRVLGLPISLQVFVLVSSVAPLRAYVHSQGFVHFRHDEKRSFKKIPGKMWLLSQLWRHLAESEGPTSVRKAREALDFAILRVLLAAEPTILTSLAELQHKPPPAARYRSQQSFQLLRMGVILNAALQPTILEIDPLPALHDIGTDSVLAGVPFTVLRDTFRLIFASDVVHNDVMEALQAVASQDTGILGINCLISNELCLTQEDLLYLLSTRRESLSIGEFRRFYPAVPSEPKSPPVYASLLEKLQKELETSSTICTLLRDTLRHTTADMDQLLTNMERFFSSQETEDEEYVYQTEPRIKYASFNLQSLTLVRSRISHSQISSQETGKIRKKTPACSDDPSNAAYLRELHIEPAVRLSPNFSPLWSEYRAEVEFMVTSVRISASAMSCSVSVHFDDREIGEHLQSSAYNATLGLGENHINVQLFTTNDLAKETSSSAVNVYSITIVRREAESPGHFEPTMQHQVCSLRQECKFRFSPNESCGLHSEWEQLDWTEVTERHSKLPRCDSGQAFGRWILPCENCNNRSSCWWHLAKWQPYSCTHYMLDQAQLRQCLDGKKVLFLGDSTIRGVMHYILERLNGSLSAKDKTHSLRTYSGLNSGRTALSFAYYPQFWLRAPQRPVFAKTLYRLLLKSQPLRNTTDTVIVVGGVHWLATHHLHTLLRAVRREGLQGARLVVKTLGSGFHIPTDGVHLLSKRQQEKLLLHSQGLVAFAQHYHMDVVDTFNMTAARYLDFLPGKCACHFHKISDNGNAGYHVEGPINAIYSEILLSRVCPLK